MKNVAGDVQYQTHQKRLHRQLTDRMQQQGDKGHATEMDAHNRQDRKSSP